MLIPAAILSPLDQATITVDQSKTQTESVRRHKPLLFNTRQFATLTASS
jgi:hypothetical protein